MAQMPFMDCLALLLDRKAMGREDRRLLKYRYERRPTIVTSQLPVIRPVTRPSPMPSLIDSFMTPTASSSRESR